MKFIITIIACLFCFLCFSQDSHYIKVHFLYGSKPLKKHKDTEPKWFGGVKGGHVGLESDSNKILNFVPNGKFHWFSKSREMHSSYAIHSAEDFYKILGTIPGSVKKAIIFIPVTSQQKFMFDSIGKAYLYQTPYDYALFGMRCGAAAYEILGQLGILPAYSLGTTYKKVFYPKKLRKRLFKKAKENQWPLIIEEGSVNRKWERG